MKPEDFPKDFHEALKEMRPEIEALLAGTYDVAGAPLTLETLKAKLAIRPYSQALYQLGAALPLPLIPSRRNNQLLRDLNIIIALSLSFEVRHGLGLIIDYSIGAEYELMIEILGQLGATKARDYLIAGRTACGGSIPVDELERGELSLQHEDALREIDLKYEKLIAGEIESALVNKMARDLDYTLDQLNQILPPDKYKPGT